MNETEIRLATILFFWCQRREQGRTVRSFTLYEERTVIYSC